MKKILAVLFTVLLVNTASAQSLKDLLGNGGIKDAVSNAVNELTGNEFNIEGTWIYEESAIEFESDNLLKTAGAAVASNQMQSKIDEELARIGIGKGSLEYTFNADNSFTAKAGNIPSRGTYLIDKENKSMEMSYAGGILKTQCKIKYSSDKLTLLFKADKLIEIVSTISGVTDINTLKMISNLLNEYDGCNIGFVMKRK